MKARDLMMDVATVRPDDPAERLVEVFRDPSVRVAAVVEDSGKVRGIVTDEDLLGAVLPSYVLADESLAGGLEGAAGEQCRQRLAGKRIRDVVDLGRRARPVVVPDDTLIEVGAAMARSTEPGVLVVERGRVLGAITVGRLLHELLNP
jgi:CBS domain-containing protein